MQQIQIIAHRGASMEAPENTLAAFSLAAAQGATMWELDVRRSGDGQLVVFHDATTERFEKVGRPVNALTLVQLRQIDLGDGKRIPTFAEVCALAREHNCSLHVELKEGGCEEQLAQTLARFGLYHRTIVSSFHAAILMKMRVIAPALPRALLMGLGTLGLRSRLRQAWPLRALERVEATAWHPHYRLLTLPGLLRMVRSAGYQVNVWTVNKPGLGRRLAMHGITGLITDVPGSMLKALQPEQCWTTYTFTNDREKPQSTSHSSGPKEPL